MTVAPQADTEVVSGVIQGIVQKGPDKWQVEVNTGQQNPRRLWTKDQSLVAQLSMMIGQQTSFLCGKSHWTNNSGQPVTSLWINGVGPSMGQQAPPQQQGYAGLPPAQQPWAGQPPQQQQSTLPIPQPQPTVVQQGPRLSEEERESRIMRQTASKVAGILISHVGQDQRTLDNVLRISEQLVAYYRHGLQMENPGDGYDPGPQGIPHDDDQIPF